MEEEVVDGLNSAWQLDLQDCVIKLRSHGQTHRRRTNQHMRIYWQLQTWLNCEQDPQEEFQDLQPTLVAAKLYNYNVT